MLRSHHGRYITMPKHGKKYDGAPLKKVDREKLYTPRRSDRLMQEIAFAKFDETVEVHARLGIDPRQADQTVRTTVTFRTEPEGLFASSFSPRVKRSESRKNPARTTPVPTNSSPRSRAVGWSSMPPSRWRT